MKEKKAKRKLTAILSADVKGYSHLMQDDEEATVRTITAYRGVMSTLIQEYDGRVVDAKGDNVLAEFSSVVDAVRCGVEIQKELKVRNAELPEKRRMEFRIGINLGDVIEEEETIYGDGVNIAARLEGLAEGGGICISRMAFDNVKNKLDVGYEYLGEHSVKNIAEPVRVYKVLMGPEYAGKVIGEERPKGKQWRWLAAAIVLIVLAGVFAIWNFYFRPPPIEPASVEKMAYPLPDKPSIAVLPFDNLTGDTQKNYIADGFTEDVITALSKVPKLFVIARSSTFTFKDKPVKIQRVAEELGVRYVLEGSVRQSKNKMRINAQLIDATTGKQLWAERYDRNLRDIFALQDEITKSIIIALQVELTEGEQARVYYAKGTDSLDAYLKHLQSREYFMNFKMDLAKQAAKEVIALDPEWAQGYSRLATLMLMEVWFHSSKSPKESLREAESLSKKAIQMDESLAHPHAILGQTYLLKRQFDDALYEGRLAVEICPSCADNIAWLGMTLRSVGQPEEAIQYLEKAIRLSPLASGHVYVHLGLSYFFAGQYQKAFDALKTAYKERPKFMPALIGLAAVCATLGKQDQAHDAVGKILELHPKFSLDAFSKTLPYKRQADKELLIEALNKAGLPETPPLPLPDRPSIAVLPFENMSGDPEQEYFSDGMTDDLITDLSKISGLFVIARNTAFQYKGKTVDVKKIGQELGVRYVLEGSVRRAQEQVRINAQLIDAKTGGHLWAERYDGKMGNIFTLQDKITGKIVTALAVKLTASEEEQVTRKGTDNMEAYDAFLKGQAYYLRRTRDDFRKAIFYFKRAIELDPNYGRAYAGLGSIYWFDPGGWLDIGWDEARNLALQNLQLAMKNPTPYAHILASEINVFLRLHKEALSEAERALALAPNDPYMHGVMAQVLIYAGRPKEAIDFVEFVMRHDPRQIHLSLFRLGLAHFSMGKYEQAASYFERAFKHNPEFYWVLSYLAATYTHLGRTQQARATLKEFTEKSRGGSTLRGFMTSCPFKDMEVADRLADGVLKAGMKGQPSGYYKIFEKNKMTGEELRELALGTDTSKYWIEGDRLCTKKWKWLSGCYPVFRNPEGTPERNDKYLLTNGSGVFPFSAIPRLKEEAVGTLDMKLINWASDADGFGKDGIFTRKNPPAFSFGYPADFKKRKFLPGQIFRIRSPDGLPSISLSVLKITGDVNESLQGSAEHFKKNLGKQGTDIKVIYNKPLPPDTYGEDYPAYEYEMEWKFRGSYELTTYFNVIAKEGYFILMAYTFRRAVDRAKAEAEAKAIFKTIDLKP